MVKHETSSGTVMISVETDRRQEGTIVEQGL